MTFLDNIVTIKTYGGNMKKENITWFLYAFGINKVYSIEGTELDKELIDAFFKMDKLKCLELIQKGANMYVKLTIKNNGVVTCGPLFEHLIYEKPWKADTAKLSKEIEDLKKNKKREKDDYERWNRRPYRSYYIDKQIEELQKRKNQEIVMVKSHNEKRENELVDFAKFWIDIGGGERPWVLGVNRDFNIIDLDKIGYQKVREYIERVSEVDKIVLRKIESEGVDWTKKGVIEKFDKATEFYRNSDYTIDEIKDKVQNDADLCSGSANSNPKILM